MKRRVWAIAVALSLIAWAGLVVQTGRWPSGDGPHVLGASMRLALDLRAGDLGRFWGELGTLLAPHPPGAYLPWTLAYLVAGPGRFVHLLASAGLIALCLDGVRRLGGGLVGALFVGASAMLWAQAEGGGVDLVAAACAVQAVSHLAASERLLRTRHTVAWGAWMGAGFLSKYTFPMFLFLPCLVAGVWVLRDKRWRALATAVGAFALVAGPWFLLRAGDVARYIGGSMAPDPMMVAARDLQAGPWYAWANLSWYPAALLDAWGWVGALALVFGLWGARRREVHWDARRLALASVAGAWLILGQSVQRQDRYMLPALPLIAAVAGGSRRSRWILPIGAVGLAGSVWSFSSAEEAPANRDFSHSFAGAGRDWPSPAEAYRPVSLDAGLWRVDEALAGLYARHGRTDGTVGLLLDDGRGAPGMGLYLFRAASLGYRWDFASVSLGTDESGKQRAMTFVGPFATDDWPSREFHTLYAAFLPSDPTRARYLSGSDLKVEQTQELPWGYVGSWCQVY